MSLYWDCGGATYGVSCSARCITTWQIPPPEALVKKPLCSNVPAHSTSARQANNNNTLWLTTPCGHPFPKVIISCFVTYENTSTNFMSLTDPRGISSQSVAEFEDSYNILLSFLARAESVLRVHWQPYLHKIITRFILTENQVWNSDLKLRFEIQVWKSDLILNKTRLIKIF